MEENTKCQGRRGSGEGRKKWARARKEKRRDGTKSATQLHVAPKMVLHPARRGVRTGRVPETQGAYVQVGVQKLHR